MSIRNRQREIQWFFDFMAVRDIEKLSEDDRAEIACMIAKHTRYHGIFDDDGREYTKINPETMKSLGTNIAPERLSGFQNQIIDFWDFTIHRISSVQNLDSSNWTDAENTEFWPVLGRSEIKLIFESEIKPIFEIDVSGIEYDSRKNRKGMKYKIRPDSLLKAKIRLSSRAASTRSLEEGIFIHNFIKLIDGVPLMAFQKCHCCNKWFVNLTKRERAYCGNRCAAKMGKRKERKESKKKIEAGDLREIEKRKIELQKGRERSKANYEKRVHANDPSAVIAHRK